MTLKYKALATKQAKVYERLTFPGVFDSDLPSTVCPKPLDRCARISAPNKWIGVCVCVLSSVFMCMRACNVSSLHFAKYIMIHYTFKQIIFAD